MEGAVTIFILSVIFLASQVSKWTLITETEVCLVAADGEADG